MEWEKAVENHKQYNSCSAAVLCAFKEYVGLTEQEAQKIASPMAGGKMGKCGAVLAAEYIISNYCQDRDQETIKQFEELFLKTGKKSLQCSELIGSCRECVKDSAKILEKIIKGE